jgi:hypothetical protein
MIEGLFQSFAAKDQTQSPGGGRLMQEIAP